MCAPSSTEKSDMTTTHILVTGASGKTGNAVIASLNNAGFFVTAYTHKESYREELHSIGAQSVIVGDMRKSADLAMALHGQQGIYHICPNMTPDEFEIGKNIIHLCQEAGCQRFVYHSVLHPQINTMPHHWQKMLVEEELFKSKLRYTILQPTAYMQNILGYRKSILEGVFPMPYSVEARISLVSLIDVAAVAAKAFSDDKMVFGIYELVGTDPLSQMEVAEVLARNLAIPVRAVETDKESWYQDALFKKMPEYARETLMAMFRYYDHYGLTGSSQAITFLLGRKPITIDQFLQDEFILNHD